MNVAGPPLDRHDKPVPGADAASRLPREAGWRAMLRNQVARGALGNVSLMGVALLFGLLNNVLLARMLSPHGFGRYAFAFTVVNLIAVPLQSGLATLLVRQLAIYGLRKEWGLLHGLLRMANGAVGTVTVLAALTLGLAIVFDGGARVDKLLWMWALVLVPLYALGALRGGALRGLHRVVLGQLPEQAVRPVVFAVLLGLVWLGAKGTHTLTPAHAMALHVAAMTVAFIVGAVLLFKWLPAPVRTARPQYAMSEWLHAVLPFTMLAGMQVLNGSLDILMLGLFKPPAEAGLFRAAQPFANLVAFSMVAINQALAPQLARCFAAGDVAQAQRLSTWSARATLATALPLAVAFVLAGGTVLGFLYGQEYVGAWPVLAALSLGMLVNAACGPAGNLLNMAGHERTTARAVAESLCLNAVLNGLLIPHYGATGAAIATMAGMMYWNLRLARAARRLTGVGSTAFSRLHSQR